MRQFVLWLMLLSCYSHQVLADALEELRPLLGNEWVLIQKDKRHDIRAYIRHEDDKPFRSFKADMRLDANIKTLISIILDFDNYTRWYWKTQTSELLKKKSPTHFIIYVVHDSPYNIPDVDVILEAIIKPQSASQASITIKVSALPDYLPLKSHLHRMAAEDMSIKVTPLPNERVHIEVQGYFEIANTILPTWAANTIQRVAPYTVLTQLKKMTELEHYQKANSSTDFVVYDYEEYQAKFNAARP